MSMFDCSWFQSWRAGTDCCCFQSWRAGTDYCRWEGVRCDAGDGRVTFLNLANCHNQVKHGLSQALFRLTSLKYLNLAGNDLGNQLPATGFERLTQLTHLNLSDAFIERQVPAGIGQLKSLVSLDLSASFNVLLSFPNELQLQKPNFQELIANLSNLRELRLDFIDISSMGAKWCDALAESTPNLQVLSLPGCSLSGQICTSLSRLRSLGVIDLSGNNLHGSVPEFLADFSYLRVLRLSSNELEGWFPTRIFQHRKLATLDVSYNGRLCGTLPKFSTNNSLRDLVISGTNFSGNIPSSIGNLKSLETLGLAASGFSRELPSTIAKLETLSVFEVSGFGLVGSIPSWIAELQSLTVLNFSDCSLSGPIPSSVCSLSHLKELVLSTCNFSGTIPLCISNINLTIVILRSNRFTGFVELTTFWNLPLEYLDLSNNRLTVVNGQGNITNELRPQMTYLSLASCNMSKFPSVLRYHKQPLLALDLSNNQISGPVPTWFPWPIMSNLSRNQLTHIEFHILRHTRLSYLDLSFNMFKGSVPVPRGESIVLDYSNNHFSSIEPSTIADLCGAAILKISNNSLSGMIPPSLCCARRLQVLDFSYNNLSGSIPSCLIEGANALKVLSLRANRLGGQLQLQNINKSCALELVDLNGNLIEGQLPRSLVACRNLMVLDVGNNRISDSFPCWVSTLPKLRILVLNSNNFFGQVGPLTSETSRCQFQGLRILDLASNNFSGSLQDEWFKSFLSMKIKSDKEQSVIMRYQNLAIQFHAIVGIGYISVAYPTIHITSEAIEVTLTHTFKGIFLIDISNNAIRGGIPKSIGKLVSLHGLNMSWNKLTGHIPSQLGNLDQLMSLDLSSNELSGEIPQEIASLNFLAMLNLSYNMFVGMIPNSPHFLTFSNSSFLGNPGLCGLQVFKKCNSIVLPTTRTVSRKRSVDILLFLFVGMGFGIGLAVILVLKWGLYRKK